MRGEERRIAAQQVEQRPGQGQAREGKQMDSVAGQSAENSQ
jgi:hypothetical protein